jgi:hypothetical protein
MVSDFDDGGDRLRRPKPTSEPTVALPAPRLPEARLAALPRHVLALQRAAGNAAVATLLRPPSPPSSRVVVQRSLMTAGELSKAAGGYGGGKYRKGAWRDIGVATAKYNDMSRNLFGINEDESRRAALGALLGQIQGLIRTWKGKEKHKKLTLANQALDRLAYSCSVELLQWQGTGHSEVGHGFIGNLTQPLSPANPRYAKAGPLFLGAQGWKLHVSFAAADIERVTANVVPFLVAAGLGHKLIKDASALSRGQEGKMLVVYPIVPANHTHLIRDATLIDGARVEKHKDVSITVVDHGSAGHVAEVISGMMTDHGVRAGPPVDDPEQFSSYAWGREGAFGAETMWRIDGTTLTKVLDPTRAKERAAENS